MQPIWGMKMSDAMDPLLKVCDLTAGYGKSQILFGMNLKLFRGEVVSLLGRNGMGKTTTVKSIVGILTPTGGSVRFDHHELCGAPIYRAAQVGVGLVPEGRCIFPNLTVRENIVATARRSGHGASSAWDIDRVLALFPRLGERLNHFGNQLSGGEQQMLAIGRALATNPSLLILDKATEGLAPLIRLMIWDALLKLKAGGQSILVIDKDIRKVTEISDRSYVIERGHVVWEGPSRDLREDVDVTRRYIGV
ncbi:Branched-chain amino acid transport system ATP-binding protein OS=Castellaniella defragrans OX=75697 GN=HNR28_002269 PE=3 SV=1 [Castellaniella defragrans]